MSRIIRMATTQMDANPAPTDERLARAEKLVTKATEAGAQLVVLPELFNTGYAYSPQNHRLAEPMNGPTPTWMRETAARLDVHLTGSLMLLDGDEVFNALLLFAPDGRMWRYDKNYPWGWERGYFRDSDRIAVAHTDLGKIGFLICWDTAHANLWQRYAGRVDLMVISSCPPDVTNPTYHFPDGSQVTVDELGPAFGTLKGTGECVFDQVLSEQTAWLGVPAIYATGAGHIKTDVPQGVASLLGLAPTAPWLAKYLPQANVMQLSAGILSGCKVVDASGQVVTTLAAEDGEAFTVCSVTLAEETPSPQGAQPVPNVPKLAYLLSDTLLPLMMIPIYRNGLRQVWGERMAPVSPSSKRWAVALGVGVGAAFLIGTFLGRRKS
jgi:hypothetical protein